MAHPDSNPETAAAPTGDTAGENTTPAEGAGRAGAAPAGLRDRVVAVLKQCYDPEIPVDIYELGLIYDLDIDAGGNTAIKMTLTSPMCPVAESLPPEVERRVGEVDGVRDVRVDVVWDPPWDKEMMSEVARLKLNMF